MDIDGEEFQYLTLRIGRRGGVDVLGWGVYEDGSVLAGQAKKVFLDNFPTEEEARTAYPAATHFSHRLLEPRVSLSHLPGEDDPVPGGMYPDDI